MREDLYDYDQLYPGRFLKSGEFKGKDVTLTIRDVDLEELADEKGTKKNDDGEKVKIKGVLFFHETEKGIVLNRTNGECLKRMFGRKPKDWLGKKVAFYPDTVTAFGDRMLAIRVRGSPDIAADIEFDLRLPQKKAKKTVLKRTGGAQEKPAAAAQGKPQ